MAAGSNLGAGGSGILGGALGGHGKDGLRLAALELEVTRPRRPRTVFRG